MTSPLPPRRDAASASRRGRSPPPRTCEARRRWATSPSPLPDAPPDLELTLPARAENVAVVRHAFGGLGDVLAMPEQTLADVKLAVTEACTNVVVHAYPDGDGPMEVAAGVRDGRLTVAVRDEGRGIDRKSTRLNSSHANISYAVFCLKKKKKKYICT